MGTGKAAGHLSVGTPTRLRASVARYTVRGAHTKEPLVQSFDIVPVGVKPIWLLAPVFLLLLGVAAVLFLAASGGTRARFEVSSAGLRLRGDLYGRFIPAASLVAEEIAAIDLQQSPDYAPRLRTMGTALPGYQAGWFRLRNGEKALLYLTDRHHVVRIPTRAGYVVELSVADPDALVRALRATAGQGGS